jgi:hypothetical protein
MPPDSEDPFNALVAQIKSAGFGLLDTPDQAEAVLQQLVKSTPWNPYAQNFLGSNETVVPPPPPTVWDLMMEGP